MSEPPHPLMHFGMAGWFEIRHEITSYKKSAKSEDQSTWPPKYCIFALETAEEPKCEAAFVDFRRFGRVRLVDCPIEDIRQVSPLKENGPDPVIDRELVTEEWFTQSLSKKKLRVKTYLLSQGNISGVGNWVGLVELLKISNFEHQKRGIWLTNFVLFKRRNTLPGRRTPRNLYQHPDFGPNIPPL